MYVKGFFTLMLAHHPICWQYRNHVIRIYNIPVCLGCFGVYSGIITGIGLLWIGMFLGQTWIRLVTLAILLYTPTILRIVEFPFFTTSKKWIRFLFRYCLGLGIAIGLLSIYIASSIQIQVIQVLFGIILYIALNLQRVFNKDQWKECDCCSYYRSNNCPGFRSFFIPDKKEETHLNLDVDTTLD